MKLIDLDHVAISVKDLNQSYSWYQKIFGFQILHNWQTTWMIGDGLNDIQAGNVAGCQTLLVSTVKVEQIERFMQTDRAWPMRIACCIRQAALLLTTTTIPSANEDENSGSK